MLRRCHADARDLHASRSLHSRTGANAPSYSGSASPTDIWVLDLPGKQFHQVTHVPHAGCDQQPVAAVDLEPSLIEQMEQSFGSHFDRTFVPRSFGRISYDSRTREVHATVDPMQALRAE